MYIVAGKREENTLVCMENNIKMNHEPLTGTTRVGNASVPFVTITNTFSLVLVS